MDLSVVIFRGLRLFRDRDPSSPPLLALLCGLARDPLLRGTIDPIVDLEPKSAFDRDRLREALSRSLKDRLNDRVLDKVVRNAASSWTQAGHLAGRTFKKRQRVDPTPGSAAMALLLGYLQGVRGLGLLKTIWCRVLDASPEAMANLASKGRALGLLKFRKAGEVIDVEFPELVSSHELAISYEPH